MIKNEFQYGVTKKQIEDLKSSIELLKNFNGNETVDKPTPEELKLEIGAIHSQIQILDEEIKEYLEIKNGTKTPSFPKDISDIGNFLIESRIAANLSQAELAKLVNTKTQVIQRYEATNYSTANLARVERIVEAIYSKDEPKGNDSSLKHTRQKAG